MNESGFRPPLCTYRLNWARRTSWGWWDDWDDTVLQTQDSKFEPWRSEAEHATSRSRSLLQNGNTPSTLCACSKTAHRWHYAPHSMSWRLAIDLFWLIVDTIDWLINMIIMETLWYYWFATQWELVRVGMSFHNKVSNLSKDVNHITVYPRQSINSKRANLLKIVVEGYRCQIKNFVI